MFFDTVNTNMYEKHFGVKYRSIDFIDFSAPQVSLNAYLHWFSKTHNGDRQRKQIVSPRRNSSYALPGPFKKDFSVEK